MAKTIFYYFAPVVFLIFIFMWSGLELSFAQHTPDASAAQAISLYKKANLPNTGVTLSICQGNKIPLSTNPGVSYLWSPSTGLSSVTVANPVCAVTVTTTYTVVVTNVNNTTSTDYVTVTVYATPKVNFSATSACFTNATVFTDHSVGNVVQWNWNFGEPSSGINNASLLQNPTHTYNSPGSYTVTLIAFTPQGCSDTSSATVTVYPLPVTGFSSTTVCIGSPTRFTDISTVSSGAITSWSWNFGDPASGASNISNVQNPSHVFSAVGNFNVLLTVTSSNGCQSTGTLTAVVMFPPVAAFTVANTCLHAATVFTNQSTHSTQWSWDFGDGGISGVQTPTHTYSGYGNYVVTLISTWGNACADTAIDTVAVYPLPVVNFLTDTVCQGDTTSFFDLSYISAGAINAWHWNFGDGNISALRNPTHVYAVAGNYTVTLTAVSGSGCSDSLTLPVAVHPPPKVDFFSSPLPTAQLTDVVYFKDLSTGDPARWWWNFGDGDTSHIQYPSHVYSDTGIFVVKLIVNSSLGCADSIQHTVEIKDFTFYIPNAFTPDGDGTNDFFFGEGVGIMEYELNIFDRLGSLIFYCKVNDLPQALPCRWDGSVQTGASKKPAQSGIYAWKVNLTDVFNNRYTYTGNVSIVK